METRQHDFPIGQTVACEWDFSNLQLTSSHGQTTVLLETRKRCLDGSHFECGWAYRLVVILIAKDTRM
eukprot:718075-Amphidinium_carterae.1